MKWAMFSALHNGLVPDRPQAIILTNDYQVLQPYMTSLGHRGLAKYQVHLKKNNSLENTSLKHDHQIKLITEEQQAKS